MTDVAARKSTPMAAKIPATIRNAARITRLDAKDIR
jgi:hypothetical protein